MVPAKPCGQYIQLAAQVATGHAALADAGDDVGPAVVEGHQGRDMHLVLVAGGPGREGRLLDRQLLAGEVAAVAVDHLLGAPHPARVPVAFGEFHDGAGVLEAVDSQFLQHIVEPIP